jgi:hypothetical protein
VYEKFFHKIFPYWDILERSLLAMREFKMIGTLAESRLKEQGEE